MDITTIAIAAAFFIAGVFITRWIFSIKSIVNTLDDQRLILLRIAEKIGVNEVDLLKITNPEKYYKIQAKLREEEYKVEAELRKKEHEKSSNN